MIDSGQVHPTVEEKTLCGFFNRTDTTAKLQSRTIAFQFAQQHLDYLQCRTIAEELTQRLLVIGDAVTLNERDEVALRITAQSGDAEMRVL